MPSAVAHGREQIARGVVWRLVEVVGAETCAFTAFVLLARLLDPAEFGVVAMASLFIASAQLFLHQGLGEVLVQGQDIDTGHFSSAFWINLLIGAMAAAVLVLGAEVIAVLMSEPMLEPVLKALAPVLIVLGASGIYQAMLRRELKLKGFACASICAVLAAGVVALVLALAGAGAWSLVAQQWTYGLIGLIVFMLFSRWLPVLRVERSHLSRLLRFGGLVTLSSMLRFAMRRLDLLVLGYFLSSLQVGYYFLANRLLFSVGMLTYYSIQQIGLPVLSRLTQDPKAHLKAVHDVLRLTSLFCLPIFTGLGLVADPLISAVFGSDWSGSIAPFQVLCFFSIFYALALIAGQVLLSAGHAGLFLKLSAINVALFLAAVAIAAPYGVVAAAGAGGLANMLVVPAYLVILRSKLGFSLRQFFWDQWPVWLATMALVVAVAMTMKTLPDSVADLWLVIMSTLVGGGVFASVLLLFCYEDIIALCRVFRQAPPLGGMT